MLERFGDVSAVVSRRLGQNPGHDAALRDAAVEYAGRVAFRRSASRAGARWGGYTFNPGLRRIEDWRLPGSFASIGEERAVSAWFKQRGMRLAALEVPACETTGLFRRVDDERSHLGAASLSATRGTARPPPRSVFPRRRRATRRVPAGPGSVTRRAMAGRPERHARRRARRGLAGPVMLAPGHVSGSSCPRGTR